MSAAQKLFAVSVFAAGLLVVLLVLRPREPRRPAGQPPLIFYCAAGLKPPVERIAAEYERVCGVRVQLQYGGSGTLLSNLRVAGVGDLFLAGDASYLDTARSNRLVAEVIPLARLTPVIAVRKGNPRQVRGLADLLRPEVAVALASPDAAAVGRICRQVLQHSGQWAELEKRAKVFKPTVTDIANDIKLGTADAGIVWDATVAQYPELEAVRVEALASGEQLVAVGVLSFSRQPSAALRFARYLGARDKGLREFARASYRTVEGDQWAERPEVVLFSGGVNRLAVEPAIQRFEQREGVRVVRVYNGCGILVAQMKSGQRPDAYLACDTSYLPPVAELFSAGTELSETDIVVLVAKGNPKGIRSLADLAKPGLSVGVANAQQSTLGDLTARMLRAAGILEAVMANVKTQTPTADLLVNQMRTGALDAVVVYQANTSQVRQTLEVVPLNVPGAKAVQPYAVGKDSKHRWLMARLQLAIASPESRRHYESLGFRWRAP